MNTTFTKSLYKKINFLFASIIDNYDQDHYSDEERLISNAQKDPANFAKIYNLYFERIFLYIHKRVQNEFAADDITSQTFYLALKNIHSYKFQGFKFSSWLFKIATNELNNYYRKNKNAEMHVHIDAAIMDRIMAEGDELWTNEKIDELISSMSKLDYKEVQLLEWRFFEGRTFKEIGFFMQITEDNAKVKTYRLLEKLKKLILKSAKW